MAIKTVTLVGGSGLLGSHILNALLDTKQFDVTVLSRPDSKAAFPDGVKVKRADHTNKAALVEAFKGQDAVLSALGTFALESQPVLIEAAAEAGVKRFLPSEYGLDTTNEEVLKVLPFLQAKVNAVKQLQSLEKTGLTWTSIVTGLFYDFDVSTGFSGIDHDKKEFTLYDVDTPSKTTTNTLPQVGRAVASVLLHPEETKNRYLHLGSFVVTREERLAALEKATGEKYTPINKSTYDLEREGNERLQKGDEFGGILLILVATHRRGLGGDFGLHKNDNKLLGLPEEDLVEVTRAALPGNKA